jgi:hypothetical protein
LQALDLLFQPRHLLKALVPTPFELARDQPVRGINRIVLPARMRHLVARLFEGELALTQLFPSGPLAIGNQLQRRLKGQR